MWKNLQILVKLSVESSYIFIIPSSPIIFFMVVSLSLNIMAFLGGGGVLDFMEPFQSI